MIRDVADDQLYGLANRVKTQTVLITGEHRPHGFVAGTTDRAIFPGGASGIGKEAALLYAKHGFVSAPELSCDKMQTSAIAPISSLATSTQGPQRRQWAKSKVVEGALVCICCLQITCQ